GIRMGHRHAGSKRQSRLYQLHPINNRDRGRDGWLVQGPSGCSCCDQTSSGRPRDERSCCVISRQRVHLLLRPGLAESPTPPGTRGDGAFYRMMPLCRALLLATSGVFFFFSLPVETRGKKEGERKGKRGSEETAGLANPHSQARATG